MALLEEISEEELKEVLFNFQKDKIPGSDGWTVEFLQGLFDIIGDDLLKVVEDSRVSERIPTCFNSTFIAPIPKTENPISMDEHYPISLYNFIYKVIPKIIARRIKVILSRHISTEQFGFLEGRKIHEAISVAQEGMHSIKYKKLKGAILKIELSKAYDKFSWMYIRLLLTHLGFHIDFIRWVMSFITTIPSILINGATSPFFHSERGIRKGCLISPMFFLLVAEGLS